MDDIVCFDVEFNRSFTRLYRMYARRLVRYLRRIVNDNDVAEELLQDVFLRVYEKKIELAPGTLHANNYLYAMARNAAIDFLRRRDLEQDKLRELVMEDIQLGRTFYESIEDSFMRGEVISTMSDVLASFPKKDREIYVKKVLEGKRRSSVAQDIGLSPYRVKKTEEAITRAIRRALRTFFNECE